ncbi:MAG: DEAD/DEAH box helicase [Spirochaetia bacterium]
MTESSPGENALLAFHPLIRRWFLSSVGRPTEVQAHAWPVIARGGHVLVSAPTGTGKTLAAFLWGINQLADGSLQTGKVRILYVSPLKALNNDIQRNLLAPLSALEAVFRQAGEEFPCIRVLTRSGDTPAGDRRRMLRSPPEILITTPESLNLILSSPNGRLMLDGVATVILDEIHAVAGSKRGTHLVTAVDRLVRLSGEFQRIALSATVKPLSAIAALVGGFTMEHARGHAGDLAGASGAAEPVYRKRPVGIVHCPMSKTYELRVEFPAGDTVKAVPAEEPVFDAIARECRRIIAGNRSTLFFVNSRRHAEKLARFINEGLPQPLAWSHHGSLSRELRLVVEQRLKKGELKAIVATSSLELGIDIGSLDQVVLVQTPFTVASAVQRLGRAGHRVGEPSRGVLFPLHGKDIVDAAVTAKCVREQDIDEIAPVVCPLDVLAQVIVSMTSVETWNAGELFDFIRAGFPFQTLPRRQFDLVLEMLAGRYEETRIRDLSAMLSYDRIGSTLRAKEGARLRLSLGGGTIPDRGYFSMRAADSKALIGELDEEFVWERALGDTFLFGAQGWRIQKIDHQNVEVAPVEARIGMSPFWKAEERNRDFHISDRIARALEEWNPRVNDERLPADLAGSHGLAPAAARAMIGFLARQREVTGTDLPHRHHLLVEHTRDPHGTGEGASVVLHTLWGGRVNRPFGLALSGAWEERFGLRPEMIVTNDAILLLLPRSAGAGEILSLVNSGSMERLLRSRLEGSGIFGARFRESAGTALLLPRAAARRRTPLWLTRQRAKSLFAAVSGYEDFPLLLEAWRACLRDEFDLTHLRMALDELEAGVIRVGEVSTSAPSPFCGELVWKQTSTLMYADDAPQGRTSTNIRGDLVRELALSSDLRPRIDPGVMAVFQAKLQRTAPGYAPRDSRELLDWVKERLLLPMEEWETLLEACVRESGIARGELLASLAGRIVEHLFGASPAPCIAPAESMPRLRRGIEERDDEALEGIITEWLRFYGPIEPSFAARVFGLAGDRLESMLADLVEQEQIVIDRLAADSELLLLCDRENLEILLRISRARARPVVRTLPAEELPRFVARQQGLLERGVSPDDMKSRWDKLFGFPLPAHLWEEEVLPARLNGYVTRWLDTLLVEAGLLWLGCGRRKLTFCFEQDAELYLDKADTPAASGAAAILPGPTGRFSFWDIVDHAREGPAGLRESSEVAARLWELAWKGAITSDTYAPVRRCIAAGFHAEEPSREGARRGRRFDRWQAARPGSSYWFRILPAGGDDRDALDEEDLTRDRVRQVLKRYGVLFREILEVELPALRWSRLFRSLRLMEFSGEVVTGRFFEGIHGLQFALPSVPAELAAEPGAEDEVWWLNAADPASLCGVDVPALKGLLPSRLSSTHVVFQGGTVVLVSRRRGRELEFRVPPDGPRLAEYLSFANVLTGRDARPLSAVHVETINGEPALSSPYKQRLLEAGFVEGYRRLTYVGRP